MNDVNNEIRNKQHPNIHDFCKNEGKLLRGLKLGDDIIIKNAGKGSAFVMLDIQDYIKKVKTVQQK